MSPRRKESSPEFLALQRSQLDAKVHPGSPLGGIDVPREGWIHAIRTALGMTQGQLARRLGVSANAVSTLEKREVAGTASIASLQRAAEALECDLKIAFVPTKGLQRTIEDQATRKVADERYRVVHNMRLEAQHTGVEESLAEGVDAESWLTGRVREIWD